MSQETPQSMVRPQETPTVHGETTGDTKVCGETPQSVLRPLQETSSSEVPGLYADGTPNYGKAALYVRSLIPKILYGIIFLNVYRNA